MTSELKPCPFCGGRAKLKGGRLSQENYTVWCENLHKGSANSSKEKAIADWNTRAAPDVPELVRYDSDWDEEDGKHFISIVHDGLYVLASEAERIIADQAKENERVRQALTDMIDGYQDYDMPNGEPVLRPLPKQTSFIQRATAALSGKKPAASPLAPEGGRE